MNELKYVCNLKSWNIFNFNTLNASTVHFQVIIIFDYRTKIISSFNL